jgi:hypothetical protein
LVSVAAGAAGVAASWATAASGYPTSKAAMAILATEFIVVSSLFALGPHNFTRTCRFRMTLTRGANSQSCSLLARSAARPCLPQDNKPSPRRAGQDRTCLGDWRAE